MGNTKKREPQAVTSEVAFIVKSTKAMKFYKQIGYKVVSENTEFFSFAYRV